MVVEYPSVELAYRAGEDASSAASELDRSGPQPQLRAGRPGPRRRRLHGALRDHPGAAAHGARAVRAPGHQRPRARRERPGDQPRAERSRRHGREPLRQRAGRHRGPARGGRHRRPGGARHPRRGLRARPRRPRPHRRGHPGHGARRASSSPSRRPRPPPASPRPRTTASSSSRSPPLREGAWRYRETDLWRDLVQRSDGVQVGRAARLRPRQAGPHGPRGHPSRPADHADQQASTEPQ